jgi:FAD-NAD(P)-binding
VIINHIASDAIACTGCRRYAVIGGGLAGVATAWHLLRLAMPSSPVHLDLFDPAGEELPLWKTLQNCNHIAMEQHG